MVKLPIILSFNLFCFAEAFVGVPTRPTHHTAAITTSSSLPLTSTAGHRGCRKLSMSPEDSEDDDIDHEDDDSTNPLSKGIDSVSWLPSVIYGGSSSRSIIESATIPSTDDIVETLPLFPLGGIVYTPNSEHILNIFEPRYRQMYNDILMNGSKRFVVSMCHPSEEGRFAKMGVLFSLEELKEVSEMTEDRVKYICNHRVRGRVRMHEVLNPEAWESRDTYLKVRGTIIDDTGFLSTKKSEVTTTGENSQMDETISTEITTAAQKNDPLSNTVLKTPQEQALYSSFAQLVELQHELAEDVRFTRASVISFGVAEGTDTDPNLWTSIRLWQSYAEQRLVARQNEMQREFQERLVEFLKKELGKNGGKKGDDGSDEELPSAIGFQDLSPELQQELLELQQRMSTELRPLRLEQTLSMQKILEAEDHDERIELMRYFVEAERKRLEARKTLKNMFGGTGVMAARKETDIMVRAELGDDDKRSQSNSEDGIETSQFYDDEEDSFQ